MPTILVTGSTGTIGSRTVRSLASSPGVTVRAGVHTRPAPMQQENVQPVPVDYDQPETVRAAAEGVDAVFLITPGEGNQAELAERALEGLKAAGVPRLLRLSVLGAEREHARMFQRVHAEIEQRILASGIPYTFLRPNSYMSEFLTYFAPDPEGNIFLPWGEAGASHTDPNDVAAVAAHVLTTEGHTEKAYTLTGPEAITVSQMASTISGVSGRSVQYVDAAEDAVRQGLLAEGYPAMMVDFMLDLHAAYKAGEMAVVTDTVWNLTGRPARSFKEFAQEHADGWKLG